MKVALVCTEKLPVPPVSGGAIQQYIEGILPYLSRHHDITVFCIAHPGLPEHETVDGVNYVRVSGKNKKEYVNNVIAQLNDEFDIVHVFNRPLWIPVFSEKLKNSKFSLSIHNEMFHPEKISPETAVKCIDKVEFITTVSKFIADGIRSLYPIAEGKLKVVYSGVDVDKFHPSWSGKGTQNRDDLKSMLGKDKMVLYVSRLSPKKGADIVLKAMEMVMNVRDDVALMVVGSKWYGDNTSDEYVQSLKLYSEKLKGPVLFTGFVPPSEMPDFYSIADIFVCASQWDEPLSRVHYEAMAAGLPIITTNRGGNAEVVSWEYGNGIVIDDYSNPNAFAEAINYLLDNPATALKLGKTGRRLAVLRYKWERVANDLLGLFQDIKKQHT